MKRIEVGIEITELVTATASQRRKAKQNGRKIDIQYVT